MKTSEVISILATSVRPREAKDQKRYDEAIRMAIEALKAQSLVPTQMSGTSDAEFWKKRALEYSKTCSDLLAMLSNGTKCDSMQLNEDGITFHMSAQPEQHEITDEQAIEHLQSSGWMRNHDREMYESGLRERLADDSLDYDSLIPCEDTISRQAAIDAIMNTDETCYIYWKTYYKDLIEALPSAQPTLNNQINLCDSCRYTYPDCPAGKDDILFGNGKGGDNICACGKYEVSKQDWIPCSKDMPRQYGNYLVSIEGEEEPDIGTINPSDARGWSLCDANGFYWAYDKMLNITAWKPLPEPYRGDTECKNGNTK